jgi:hypothetical protein
MSSSFFKKLSTTGENIQSSYLGPTYKYHKNINSPRELGMSDSGDMAVLARNIAGIINYTDLLVTGKGRASKTGKPLGNKFFLKTGGQCKPVDKPGNVVDRYLYINNVPDGSIPFIAGASDFRGIIPGIIGNLGDINPLDVVGGISQDATPKCRKVRLQTIDANNRVSSATHYVADVDLAKLSGCNFPGNKNPVTGNTTSGCKQGFQLINNKINKKKNEKKKMKKNHILNLYNMGFGLLIVYLLVKLKNKI